MDVLPKILLISISVSCLACGGDGPADSSRARGDGSDGGAAQPDASSAGRDSGEGSHEGAEDASQKKDDAGADGSTPEGAEDASQKKDDAGADGSAPEGGESLADQVGAPFVVSCDAPCTDGSCRACSDHYCMGCTQQEQAALCKTYVDYDRTTVLDQISSDAPCSEKAESGGGCGGWVTLGSGAMLHTVSYSWFESGVNREGTKTQCESLGFTYYP